MSCGKLRPPESARLWRCKPSCWAPNWLVEPCSPAPSRQPNRVILESRVGQRRSLFGLLNGGSRKATRLTSWFQLNELASLNPSFTCSECRPATLLSTPGPSPCPLEVILGGPASSRGLSWRETLLMSNVRKPVGAYTAVSNEYPHVTWPAHLRVKTSST